MMNLILNKAKEDNNIRLVEMNGSRANPAVTKDLFQDYDIVYYVENLNYFLNDHSWVDYFGERIIMQMPDQMGISPADKPRRSFSYLMLFEDGNRIDLTLTPIELIHESLENQDFRKILLDKDNKTANKTLSNENPYIVGKPNVKEFLDCLNEFWWVSTYIAKALWREELTLAKFIMEGPVRDMLITMLNWEVGVRSNFTVSTGKGGKDLIKYIDSELWGKLVDTYPNGNYENIWKSLFTMSYLFNEVSFNVAKELNFEVPEYVDKVLLYLKHVEKLPKDSEYIY